MHRSCPRCMRPTAAHVRFCESCGSPVSDNTTRYLCAAVHRYSEYCEAAIAEFLIEPVRALPPSAGADSAAVLQDAVAAHTRRRIRDAILLALLLAFALINVSLFTIWLALALLGWFATRKHKRSANRTSPRTAIIVAIIAVGLYLFTNSLLIAAGLNPAYVAYELGQVLDSSASSVVSTVSLMIVGMMAVVLFGDAYLVHWLVHTWFRRDRFLTDPRHRRPSQDSTEVALRTLGIARFGPDLDRLAAADRTGHVAGKADVVVHRDFSPFVGAGVLVDSNAVSFTLLADEKARGTKGVDVVEMHEYIDAALREIKTSSSLGPSGRLGDLEMREQIFVPSDQLVTHSGAFPQPKILPSLEGPPESSVNLELARELAAEPVEWARYYRCYQVETWDRDLTISCYVHIGTDQGLLYLERVHCVLPPLAARFRRIDEPANPLEPISGALATLFLLPASVVRRLRTAAGGFRRLRQRPGEVVPDRYGAARSLRELASTSEFRTYFQGADATRYQGIVDSVLVRAVGRYLEERGYSVVEFQRAVAPVFQNFANATINNSSIGPHARTHNTNRASGPQKETQ